MSRAFIFLDTGRRVAIDGTSVRSETDLGTTTAALTQNFSTVVEAEDWLIQLFIRVNGLDATLADVPIDGTGQRDCPAWNTQLVTP